MHRTKTAALFVAVTATSAFLLFFNSSPLAKGRSLRSVLSDPQAITASFPSIDGMIFQQGQPLDIKWTLAGDSVKIFEQNPWAECELFFSADAGTTWSRISPHLGVTTRTFHWTVPSIVTREGMFALQIGIEGDGEFFFLPSSTFAVQPGQRF